MDRKFWLGMARDWGIALAIALAVFVGWNLLRPRPLSSGAAPDFTLMDLDGQEVTLSDHVGETVVLNFWATWCQPCIAEMPELEAFHRAHPDIVFYGISVDTNTPRTKVRNAAKARKITYPVLHDVDGGVSGEYGVNTLPTTFVIDPHGHVHEMEIGMVDRAKLERLVFEGG